MDNLSDIVEKKEICNEKKIVFFVIALFIRTLIKKMITDIIRLVHMECKKYKKKRIIFWSNLTRVRIVLNSAETEWRLL